MAGAGSVTASVTATGTVSVTGLILPSTASSCETTALVSRPGTLDAQECTRPAARCAHHVTRGTGGGEVGAAHQPRVDPRRRLEPMAAGTGMRQENTSDGQTAGEKH